MWVKAPYVHEPALSILHVDAGHLPFGGLPPPLCIRTGLCPDAGHDIGFLQVIGFISQRRTPGCYSFIRAVLAGLPLGCLSACDGILGPSGRRPALTGGVLVCVQGTPTVQDVESYLCHGAPLSSVRPPDLSDIYRSCKVLPQQGMAPPRSPLYYRLGKGTMSPIHVS